MNFRESFLYKRQIILLVGWVFVVLLVFNTIHNKKIAALIAGLGFVCLPTVFLIFEFLKKEKSFTHHKIIIMIFLISSAYPIFIMRILYWGEEFGKLSLFGVSMDFIHRYSNILYLSMIGSAIYSEYKNKKSRH